MPDSGRPGVLPLRPLTAAELLDAGVSLLRRYAHLLLPAAVLLAVAEQLALAPLRAGAGVGPPDYLPAYDAGAQFWLLLAVGAGTEVVIIALLGVPASRGAAGGLLGTGPSARQVLTAEPGRLPGALLIAVVAGGITVAGALLGPGWVIAYALVGLAVPAYMVDRVGVRGALVRGAGLALRGGLRAAGIRLMGYLTWLTVRAMVGIGGVAVLGLAGSDGQPWAAPAAAAVWVLVNAVAYPSLACLDAVLHLETRMRTEGLDLRLARARHRHLDVSLAVRR